jgi:hypothetical protein
MLLGASRVGGAQAIPTAKGPDSYLAFGGAVTAFQADYGRRVLGGGTVFADMNMTWRYGFESEARYLRIHTDEDVTETDYLVGPRVMFRPGRFRPYAKFLVGAGRMTFPFHYADGTFFTYAPGGGMDWILGDRVTFRVVDFEYQMWTGFATYGELRPYGLSTGISWRVNPREHLVKTAERWRWK